MVDDSPTSNAKRYLISEVRRCISESFARASSDHIMSRLISTFKVFPKELFRVNNGPQVFLRQWSPGRSYFDLDAPDGVVQPKALDASSYQAPNGASMRPNSPYQHRLVSHIFKGQDMLVYAVPSGAQLPEDLLLVHERSDHYSLQAAKEMTLDDLNKKITRFFQAHAIAYTKGEWLSAYRTPTEYLPRNGTRRSKQKD